MMSEGQSVQYQAVMLPRCSGRRLELLLIVPDTWPISNRQLAAHRYMVPIGLEHLASWVTCAPAKSLILQAIDLIEAADNEEQ